MTTYEILTLNRELLVKLSALGIRNEDCKYLSLYDEYLTQSAQKEKITYIVAQLSEKYRVSERQVYTIIRRFGNDCNVFAVTLEI